MPRLKEGLTNDGDYHAWRNHLKTIFLENSWAMEVKSTRKNIVQVQITRNETEELLLFDQFEFIRQEKRKNRNVTFPLQADGVELRRFGKHSKPEIKLGIDHRISQDAAKMPKERLAFLSTIPYVHVGVIYGIHPANQAITILENSVEQYLREVGSK